MIAPPSIIEDWSKKLPSASTPPIFGIEEWMFSAILISYRKEFWSKPPSSWSSTFLMFEWFMFIRWLSLIYLFRCSFSCLSLIIFFGSSWSPVWQLDKSLTISLSSRILSYRSRFFSESSFIFIWYSMFSLVRCATSSSISRTFKSVNCCFYSPTTMVALILFLYIVSS